MRKSTLILLLLISLNGLAQNSALEGHPWYLQRLVINDQEYLYPYQGQNVHVNFAGNIFEMYFPECVEVATNFQTQYTGDDVFTLSGNFLILLGFCINPAMIMHYSIYENNEPVNFSYVISTENNHYMLAVTNAAGNQAFYSDTELAVEDFNNHEIGIFFNPDNASLEFSGLGTDRISQLMIYNQLGQQMLSQNNVGSTLNLAGLSDGIYFARLSFESGRTFTQKFLKR